jgi:hypothetical protein
VLRPSNAEWAMLASAKGYFVEHGLVARTATQSFGARLRIALSRSFLTAIFTW